MLTVFATLTVRREQLKQRQREGNGAKAQGSTPGESLSTDWTRFGQLWGMEVKSIWGVTLCGDGYVGKHFLPTCGDENPSRYHRADLSDRQATENSSTVERGRTNAEKKKPQKRRRFRAAVIRSIRVCACCGMLHNSDYDLCGTENGCASRLRQHTTDVFKVKQ